MSVQPLPRWDDAATAGMSEAQLLLYRSNLLGSDLRITNYGGGNTSAKIRQPDPLTGEEVEVLWVKGSGGDIGSMKMDGFATLYLDKLHALKRRYRGLAHEDEMVAFFPHCTFNLNPRATSIDTPPHCFTPYRHIDHMHADALIAFAAAKNGEALIKKAFGDEIGWIPWMRPGFELGLRCEALCQANPDMKGLIFGSHGLVNWGDTSKECYQRTISIIERAAAWLDANGKAGAVRAAGGGAAARGGAAGVRRRARAAGPRHAERDHAEGDALRRRPGDPRVRRLGARRRARRQGHHLPGSLPAHEDPAAVGAVHARPGDRGAARREAGPAGRALRDRLRRLLRALQAAGLAGDARPDAGAAAGPGHRPARLPEGQADGARRRRVLRQHDQRRALGRGRRRVRPDPRAGGLRHRVLAARRGQAAAPAEGQGARRQDRAHHRRRRRHRPGGGAAAARPRARTSC